MRKNLISIAVILSILLIFGGSCVEKSYAWGCGGYREAHLEDAFRHSTHIDIGDKVTGCIVETDYLITTGDREPMYNIVTSGTTNVRYRFSVTNDTSKIMSLSIYYKDMEAAEWKYIGEMEVNAGFSKAEDFALKTNGTYFIGLIGGEVNEPFSLRVTEEPYEVKEKNHDYTEWQVVTSPTCTEVGQRQRECKICGQVFTEEIPKTGHDFSGWKIVSDPTCTEAGLKQKECSICGQTISEELPALEHSWYCTRIVKKAGNNINGEKLLTCLNDSEHTKTAVIKGFNLKVSKKKVYNVKKKNKNMAIKKPITVKGNKTKVSYKKVSGNKYFKVNAKNGKITINKKIKKGNYKIKVRVSTKASKYYSAAKKNVVLNVNIK